ncbi:MAG TPA: type IV pilus assembly protein PilM [Patescibacteria group bacterium]|nr:type IV pilus assembly protein PilM [Patescibacteria group bacterium]
MNSKTFGIDIGATSMKAVWLAKEKTTISLVSCLAATTPEKGMLSESLIDQEAMAQVIQKLVIDAKITAKIVHVALPDNQVFTKVITMPDLSEKELSSAIYWEAEQYIPAALSTVTLDYKVLRRYETATSEKKMQVLLVAAKTTLIKKYQGIFSLVGLTVASVETEIIATVRGIVSSEQSPTSFVIHIGSLNTSLAIVQQGIVIFTYSIPLGGMAMNRAIAADFGFSLSQAEEYKKTYGLTDASLGGKIGKAIQPILFSLLTEVKKALTYYSENFKTQGPVSQILLSGGSAKLPGIDLFFVQNSGIETVIANPWKVHAIGKVPPDLLSNPAQFTVAIGLALKGL